MILYLWNLILKLNSTYQSQDEKEEIFTFSFDKVFYENSEQANVFEFLALPIVRGICRTQNSVCVPRKLLKRKDISKIKFVIF